MDVPRGVHCFKTSSPKIHSLANFWASVPALPSPLSLVLRANTTSTLLNVSLLIANDGSSFLVAVVPSGIGCGWGTWTMGALVVVHV